MSMILIYQNHLILSLRMIVMNIFHQRLTRVVAMKVELLIQREEHHLK
nr:unnamed protein product [Callosobruchus chinensis]